MRLEIRLLLSAKAGHLNEDSAKAKARRIADELKKLRGETRDMYTGMIRPPRRDLMLYYIYNAVETAVLNLTK